MAVASCWASLKDCGGSGCGFPKVLGVWVATVLGVWGAILGATVAARPMGFGRHPVTDPMKGFGFRVWG